MRLIDAEPIIEMLKRVRKDADSPRRDLDLLNLQQILELAHEITPPLNDPLTLEQLREMDGEPVWVVQVNGEHKPFWMLIDAEDESAASRLYCAIFEDYGTEWIAYRRKPKVGEP